MCTTNNEILETKPKIIKTSRDIKLSRLIIPYIHRKYIKPQKRIALALVI